MNVGGPIIGAITLSIVLREANLFTSEYVHMPSVEPRTLLQDVSVNDWPLCDHRRHVACFDCLQPRKCGVFGRPPTYSQ